VPLDLELHHRAVLPCHLQVDMVVLCLHSLPAAPGEPMPSGAMLHDTVYIP
jgi:hypothetical protein